MGANASASAATRKGSRGAAAALAGVAVVAVLYLFFLFKLFNDPSAREATGFATTRDITTVSFLAFALLFGLMLLIRLRWFPAADVAPAGGPARASGAVPGGAVIPSAGHTRPRVSAEDPASRPGAPPSMSVPRIAAEELKGGWKRYRFPAERTGGLYVDSDIVVDQGSQYSDSPDGPRGRMILRVRDEVARVCVRCDLIDHCHSKVSGLITLEDMRGNSECLSGLKRMMNVKIAAIARAKEAAASAAQPPAGPPPAEEPALESGAAPGPGASPDSN